MTPSLSEVRGFEVEKATDIYSTCNPLLKAAGAQYEAETQVRYCLLEVLRSVLYTINNCTFAATEVQMDVGQNLPCKCCEINPFISPVIVCCQVLWVFMVPRKLS